MNNIKDGDFFSYTWKTGKGPSNDPYWCRDRRCVARTGEHGELYLIDTFNYWPYVNGKEDTDIFTYEGLSWEYFKYVNINLVDLELICNLNDYEFVNYDKEDYEGVIFVGYQCTQKWAKPKGSVKSDTAIRAKLYKELANEIANHEQAAWRIQQINIELSKLS